MQEALLHLPGTDLRVLVVWLVSSLVHLVVGHVRRWPVPDALPLQRQRPAELSFGAARVVIGALHLVEASPASRKTVGLPACPPLCYCAAKVRPLPYQTLLISCLR